MLCRMFLKTERQPKRILGCFNGSFDVLCEYSEIQMEGKETLGGG